MWIMTTRGFFSAVQHKTKPRWLVVRARCEDDIYNLAALLPRHAVPVYGAGTDYPWRVTCTRAAWDKALLALSKEVIYTNFKASITDKRHHDAYLRVWSALLALEDARDKIVDSGHYLTRVDDTDTDTDTDTDPERLQATIDSLFTAFTAKK